MNELLDLQNESMEEVEVEVEEAEGLADLLWAVMMKPEFQLIY